MMQLDQLAQALQRSFPDIGVVAPLTMCGLGFNSLAVETAGGIIFRIARHAAVGERYAKERQLLPVLKSYLPVAIPEPQWYIPSSADFPFGVIGYRKLPGVPLEPDRLTASAAREIAAQIGNIILTLQRVPVDGLPAGNPRADWEAQRDKVLPALRTALTVKEYEAVARWWEDLLADERMLSYTPVLQHGDLWYENLLVEEIHICGIVDFEQVGIGDPALDFTPQLYLGETFLNWVIAAYRKAGGVLDSHFDHRLRRLWARREFGGLQYAIEHNDRAEFDDSIAKLRKGAILSTTDGWRRDWANTI
jgi:aminoglycoside phosphotransferase (APT) family kinase protein